MPLIDLPERLPARYETAHSHADLAGIATVINDVFDNREPERFGTPDQRTALKKAVDLIPYHISEPYYWLALQDAIRDVGLTQNPLEGLSLAFVGGRTYGERGAESTISNAYPLTHGYGVCHFDTVYEFDGRNKDYQLTIANSNELLKGDDTKMDYVVTGNVINADDCVSDDTILACANITKKGGRIIHMLNYGEWKNEGIIDDVQLQTFAGQSHVKNIPEGKYGPYGNESGTHIMILDQDREVHHTTEDLAAYREAKASGKPLPQFHQTGADLTPSAHATAHIEGANEVGE